MIADFLKRWGLCGEYAPLSNDNAVHLISKFNEALEGIRTLTHKHFTSDQSNGLYQHWWIGCTKIIKQYFLKVGVNVSWSLYFCYKFLSVQPSLLKCARTTLTVKQTVSGWCPQQQDHILIIHTPCCCSAAGLKCIITEILISKSALCNRHYNF